MDIISTPQTISFVFPGVPHVRCAFQTRVGGFSLGAHAGGNISFAVGDNPVHVYANREALRTSLGLHTLYDVKQVHGVTTVFDPDPAAAAVHDEPALEADGMATDRSGLGLMVKSADCQPILFAHESGRFVAGIHAGWQGNRQGYPQIAVAELCAHYNVSPASVYAVRGPSLGPARSEFIHFDTEWGTDFSPWHSAIDHTVNLWLLARDQLLEAGLLPSRIFALDLCTASLPSFYSYRRDKLTGRQGSVIWIGE